MNIGRSFGKIQNIMVGMAGTMTLKALKLPGSEHGKTMCHSFRSMESIYENTAGLKYYK